MTNGPEVRIMGWHSTMKGGPVVNACRGDFPVDRDGCAGLHEALIDCVRVSISVY